MLDILFPVGTPPTCHEFLEALEARIKLIKDWQNDQSAGATHGSYLPEIADFNQPFNGVISFYARTYGPPWGPNNAWHEWADQAYRMGSQLLIEQDESEGAPWVRLWIGHANEPPGATPPELAALREWLDANPDGGQIPKRLLDPINLKDPAFERKPFRAWLEPTVGSPEELKLAHDAVQVIPRLIPVLKELLEVSVATLEQAISRQPGVTNARSERAFESVECGIATNPANLQTQTGGHNTPPEFISDAG